MNRECQLQLGLRQGFIEKHCTVTYMYLIINFLHQ